MRNRLFLSLLAGLLTLTVAAGAANAAEPRETVSEQTKLASAEAPKPTLRRAVIVAGDVVRLSDLFDNLPAKRNSPVSYAPRPGRSAIFDSDRLRQIAIKHRLAWRPRHFERSVVTRDSRIISSKAITAEIIALLRDEGLGKDIWIELDNRNMTVHVPTGLAPTVSLRNFSFDRHSRRFTAVLHAPAESPAVIVNIAGQAHLVAEVPVLKRRFKKSEVIEESDIEWLRMRADRIGRNVVTDAGDLVGKAPRRHLGAGKLIRAGDVRDPVLIEKGDLITMIYRTPSMTLSARARALEDGNLGKAIRVINLQSKKTVEAKTVDSDTVVVDGIGGIAFGN